MKSTKKYFIAIISVVFIILNVLIFLITSRYAKEAYEKVGWWLSYSMVMLAMVMLLLMRLFNKDNERKQSVFLPLLFPISFVIFIMGLVFLFFRNIPFIVPLIILIVFVGLAAVGFIFGFMYREHLDNIEVKEVKVRDMESLILYLNEVSNNHDANVSKAGEKLLDLAMVEKEDTEEVQKINKRIFEITYFMDRAFRDNKMNDFYHQVDQMEKLLKQRKELY